MSAIDDLIEHFGGESQTAIAMKVDRQLVHGWIKKGFIPFNRGNDVEAVTGGKIKAEYVWRCAASARHHGG